MTSDAEPVREDNKTPDAHEEPHTDADEREPDIPIAPNIPTPPPPKAHCQITCKPEKNLWDHVKTGAELLGVVLLAIYTSYTIKMYCANKEAANAAKSAADTAANELELSERPWIAVEEFRLTKEPYWEIFQGPKFFPPTKEMRMVTNLHVPSTFSLDNVGKSPATRVFVSVQIEPVEIGRYFHKPQLGMQIACSMAEAESRESSKSSSINEGSAIFPGAPLSQSWEPVYGASQPNLRIDEVWIEACVVYRVEFSPHIYHTKVWFESVPRLDATRLVPIGSDQGITWKPFDTFVLYDSEAD